MLSSFLRQLRQNEKLAFSGLYHEDTHALFETRTQVTRWEYNGPVGSGHYQVNLVFGHHLREGPKAGILLRYQPDVGPTYCWRLDSKGKALKTDFVSLSQQPVWSPMTPNEVHDLRLFLRDFFPRKKRDELFPLRRRAYRQEQVEQRLELQKIARTQLLQWIHRFQPEG